MFPPWLGERRRVVIVRDILIFVRETKLKFIEKALFDALMKKTIFMRAIFEDENVELKEWIVETVNEWVNDVTFLLSEYPDDRRYYIDYGNKPRSVFKEP